MTRCKLGDHIAIKHGFAFDGEFFSDEDNGVVLLTPGNFAIGGGYQEGKGKYFTGECPVEFVLAPDDLIVTMTDLSKRVDTLGYGALVPNDGRVYLHNQRIGLVQFKDDAIDKHWLSYLMRTYHYQRAIAGSSSGSTVHHSSPDKICAYELDLPSLTAQRRIASILMTYDNLIENSRRQIALLEEGVQRLFKEWFVDLRFPGHQNTEVVDGLPNGWTKCELGAVIHQSGNAEKKSNRENYSHYLPIDSIPSKSITCWDSDAIENASSSLVAFKRDDFVFGAMRPYFHKVIIAPYAGLTRTTCFVLNVGDPDYWAYAFAVLTFGDCVRYATSISVGTTMPYVRWEDLRHMPIVVPTKELAITFKSHFDNIRMRVEVLYKQLAEAREARDRLLPKLMSGEIEVEG